MKSRQQAVEAIYRTRVREDHLKHTLVLDALGIDHETHKDGGEFILFVASPDAARARAELEAYDQEDRDWPTGAPTFPQPGSGWAGVLGYVAVLMLFAVFERRGVFEFDWLGAGKTHAGLIRHGEWWRAVTALTLHVDLSHLVANIVIGGLLGLFAGQLLGSGLAWISILVAGASGNLLNACIRPPAHTSIGASTAVFAALGIMAAYVWQRRRRGQTSRLARWVPLVGGVVLLSYLGVGGGRTDVAAHVTGFLSGALLGTLFGKLGKRITLSAKTQFGLGMAALAVIALAWAFALARHAPQST